MFRSSNFNNETSIDLVSESMFHNISEWDDLIFMKWIQAEYQHINIHKNFEKIQNNLKKNKKLDFMTQWLILITLIATMKDCSMRHQITEEMTYLII